MWAELFQPNGNQSRRCHLINTILRFVKNALAIVNNFFQIEILRNIIDSLNDVINLSDENNYFNNMDN